MDEQKAEHEKRERWVMEERHYKAVSQWLERAALLFAASLVVQKIVAGAKVSDPVVIAGAISALVIYAIAYIMLLRS
jgi:hypothetical protein